MTCLRTRQMLDGWLDGELDPATGEQMARHVAQCPDCLALRDARGQLRATLRAAAPRFAAPSALRQSVLRQLNASERPRGTGLPLLAWWQALTLAGAASLATALISVALLRPVADAGVAESVREQVVSRHVAALAGTRLYDVASTDSHVIKPWFQGKIDFAPMVRDLSRSGFVLQGARQERVAGQAAVAVVYKIREHPVNLFVWRQASAGDAAYELATVRGFSVGTWAAGGLHYAAVSDLDAADLDRFARELQSPH